MSSVLTLIVGELLKLVLIERLFSLTRDKLMKTPSFNKPKFASKPPKLGKPYGP